jgi:hypothetical protein
LVEEDIGEDEVWFPGFSSQICFDSFCHLVPGLKKSIWALIDPFSWRRKIIMNISILSGFVWPQGFREVFELVSPEVR